MTVIIKKAFRLVSKPKSSYGEYSRVRPNKIGWHWVWTVEGPKVAEIRVLYRVDGKSLSVWCCACSSVIDPGVSDEQIRRSTKIILWGPECRTPAPPTVDDPMSRCGRCGGSGKVRVKRALLFCEVCDGAGFWWGKGGMQ